MPKELRCGGTMHGILSEDGTELEVKCKRRTCGKRNGVIVLHTFDLASGKLKYTKRFKEPPRDKE